MPRRRSSDLRPGDTFGRLTVTGASVARGTKTALIPIRCECGTERMMPFSTWGKSESCGCLQSERSKQHHTRHGDAGGTTPRTRLYRIWVAMRYRCAEPRDKDFASYGGRGITVCVEWKDDYAAFRAWALDSGYAKALEIDRVDNDGPYSPDNCRWVTHSQNLRNTRASRKLGAWGETRPLVAWVEDERCVVAYDTARQRIDRGWSVEDALTTQVAVKRQTSSMTKTLPSTTGI